MEDVLEFDVHPHAERTIYKATLDTVGKVAAGDSMVWSVMRISEQRSASVYESVTQEATRTMSLGFVQLPSKCLSFGNGMEELRARLIQQALSKLPDGKDPMSFGARLVTGHIEQDAEISGLMTLALADYLGLSSLCEGVHDSLLMGHPLFAGVPLLYQLRMDRSGRGLQGDARFLAMENRSLPPRVIALMGRNGRHVSLQQTRDSTFLTVVDTIAQDGAGMLFGPRTQILSRSFRAAN